MKIGQRLTISFLSSGITKIKGDDLEKIRTD
jgi:hypothetical protein